MPTEIVSDKSAICIHLQTTQFLMIFQRVFRGHPVILRAYDLVCMSLRIISDMWDFLGKILGFLTLTGIADLLILPPTLRIPWSRIESISDIGLSFQQWFPFSRRAISSVKCCCCSNANMAFSAFSISSTVRCVLNVIFRFIACPFSDLSLLRRNPEFVIFCNVTSLVLVSISV